MWTKTDIRRVSGETLLREDTITRWLKGGKVRATTVKLIEEAAARLDLEMPHCEESDQQQVA